MLKILNICCKHRWKKIVWKEVYENNAIHKMSLYQCEFCGKQKWTHDRVDNM